MFCKQGVSTQEMQTHISEMLSQVNIRTLVTGNITRDVSGRLPYGLTTRVEALLGNYQTNSNKPTNH